jgi:antitoxin ChpS
MHHTVLRKVGGSVMLAVPPALLDLLNLQAGTSVGLEVEDGRMIVSAHSKPKYTLEDLLAQCDGDASPDEQDREWLNVAPVGREL